MQQEMPASRLFTDISNAILDLTFFSEYIV